MTSGFSKQHQQVEESDKFCGKDLIFFIEWREPEKKQYIVKWSFYWVLTGKLLFNVGNVSLSRGNKDLVVGKSTGGTFPGGMSIFLASGEDYPYLSSLGKTLNIIAKPQYPNHIFQNREIICPDNVSNS